MAKTSLPLEKNMVIPKEGATTVGGFAFNDCRKIENIVIREGVTEIEYFAFNGCINLLSVKLPSSLKIIRDTTFTHCFKLETIDFPDGLERIDASAFRECESLKEVRLPDSLTSLGSSVFESCSNLRKVYLPKSLIKLNSDLFADDVALEEIVFPQDLQEIDCGVFSGCTSLKKVILPASVVEINGSAFKKTVALEEIVFSNSLRTIGHSTFSDCSSLTSVQLPDAVEVLGEKAFRNCKNLRSVKLSKSLKKIGSEAFSGCENLKEVEIPASVEEIGREAFPPTTKIVMASGNQHIKLEDGLLLSADGATLLSCLYDTDSVSIPSSVREIGEKAFYQCASLTGVTLGDNVEKVGKACFAYCPSLQRVDITGKLLSIGEDAFYRCEKLSSINFPESLVSIGNGAFRECKKLKSIVIPAAVQEVSRYAFASTGLSKIDIRTKGKLGGFAFAYCNSLKQVELPSHTICGCSFDECKALSSITLLDSVSAVEKSAFMGCSKITSIHVSALNMDVDVKTLLEYNDSNDIQLAGGDKGWLKQIDEKIVKLMQAAKQGDAKAQYSLGAAYYNGEGVQKSPRIALEWFTKAAKQDNARAQFALGILYSNCDDVPRNMKMAIEWYTKAAEQGDLDAQFNLALCYEQGNGVPQNYEVAAEWYRKSADQGDEDAAKKIKKLQDEGLIASENSKKLTDAVIGVLRYNGETLWIGSTTVNFTGKGTVLEIQLEGSEDEGPSDAQRNAYINYLQKKDYYFNALQQKAQENFKAANKKRNNRIVPTKLYIGRDGNYGWAAYREWDAVNIAVILSDSEVQMADEQLLFSIDKVKQQRSKTEWYNDDPVYYNLFGHLITLYINVSDKDGEEKLTDKEVELLKWLVYEYDSNKMKKDVLKYCNDSYDSWGGDLITADDLLEELSLTYIRLHVEEAESSNSQPDICLSGDCNCDDDHGIAICFRDRKLQEIADESIAF